MNSMASPSSGNNSGGGMNSGVVVSSSASNSSNNGGVMGSNPSSMGGTGGGVTSTTNGDNSGAWGGGSGNSGNVSSNVSSLSPSSSANNNATNGGGGTANAESASSSANNPLLLKEFEESYRRTYSALTAEDLLNDKSRDILLADVEEKLTHFVETARNLETFFLQKRVLHHAYKPESILREESSEMKQELAKKDELINKHSEKLKQWEKMLSDNGIPPPSLPQHQQPPHPMQPGGPHPPDLSQQHHNIRPPPPGGMMPPHHGGMGMQPGMGTPHGGFIPGNNYRMQTSPGGPLAYLERTTTSIGR